MIPSAYAQLTQDLTFPGSPAIDGFRNLRPRRDNADDLNQKYLELSLANVLPSYPLSNPFEQVAHYKSAVYLGIQTLMDALSGATVLFEVKSDGTGGSPAPGAQRSDDEYIPLPGGHILLDKIRKPNPSDTFASFLSKCVLQYHLTGRLLIWMVPNENGLPVRFYVLPTALVNQAFNVGISARYPLGAWRVQQLYPSSGMAILPGPWSGQLGTVIDARELMIIQNPHPLFPWAPYSPLTGMDVQMDVLEMIDRSAWSIYRQGVRPTGIFDLPGAGPDQVEAFQAQVANKYGGPDNHGIPLVMGGGRPDRPAGKYQQVTPTSDSMAYDTRNTFEGLILTAVTGQDRSVVGLREGGSYAERWAAIQDVRNRKYVPWLGKVASAFTDYILSAWNLTEQGVRCAIRLPRMDDPTLIASETQMGVTTGLITADEGRARIGLGPHPSGMGNYSVEVMNQLIISQFQDKEGNVKFNPTTGAGDNLEQNDDTATGNDSTGTAQLDAQSVEQVDENTALGSLMSTMQGPQGGIQYPTNPGGKGSLGGKGSRPPRKQAAKPKGKKVGKVKKSYDNLILEVNRQVLNSYKSQPFTIKGQTVDDIKKHIAANPHDLIAHRILGDAYSDEGNEPKATLHRYIGEPTEERRDELIAAHGGTSGAAYEMSKMAYDSTFDIDHSDQGTEEGIRTRIQSHRAISHAERATTTEVLRSGHHANAEHAHYAVAQELTNFLHESPQIVYAHRLHTLAHSLHKHAWDEDNPVPETKSFNHSDIVSLRKAVADDPTNTLHRGVLADALDDVGEAEEASAHRYVAERTPERFKEVLAAHEGDHLEAATALAKIAHEISNKAHTASDENLLGYTHSQDARINAAATAHNIALPTNEYANRRYRMEGVIEGHDRAASHHNRAAIANAQNIHIREGNQQATELHSYARDLHQQLSDRWDSLYPEDTSGAKALPEPRTVKSEADLEAHSQHVQANPTDVVARLTYADHLQDYSRDKEAAIQRILAEPHNPEHHEALRAAGGTIGEAAFEASGEALRHTVDKLGRTNELGHQTYWYTNAREAMEHANQAQRDHVEGLGGSYNHQAAHLNAEHMHDTNAESHDNHRRFVPMEWNESVIHKNLKHLHSTASSLHRAAAQESGKKWVARNENKADFTDILTNPELGDVDKVEAINQKRRSHREAQARYADKMRTLPLHQLAAKIANHVTNSGRSHSRAELQDKFKLTAEALDQATSHAVASGLLVREEGKARHPKGGGRPGTFYSAPNQPNVTIKGHADKEMIHTFENTPELHTDKTARLAYADALEEEGHGHLAAFHRAIAEPENDEYRAALHTAVGNDPDKAYNVSQHAARLSEYSKPSTGSLRERLVHRALQKAGDREHGAAAMSHYSAAANHSRANRESANDLDILAMYGHIVASHLHDTLRGNQLINPDGTHPSPETPTTKAMDVVINAENLIEPPVQTTPTKLKRKRKVLAKQESQLLVRSIADRILQEPAHV